MKINKVLTFTENVEESSSDSDSNYDDICKFGGRLTDSEDCEDRGGDDNNELNYYKAVSLINSFPQELQTAIENDDSRYNTNIDELRIIRQVLNTPFEKRTQRQTEKLVEQMMEFDYFEKKSKEMKNSDFQEVISKMKWESKCVLDDIYN